MRWTQQQYDEFIKHHPQAGDTGLRSSKPEQSEGVPLVGAVEGKSKSRIRASIRFTVHSKRPLDWDNYRFKELQDLLAKVGILDGDEWDILSGTVISKKIHKEDQEKTVVEIIYHE